MNKKGDKDPGIVTSRRAVLALGAVAASTVVTIRPAMAQAAGSILTCEIPVPDPKLSAGSYIAPDGSLVSPGTPGAFAPATRPLKGEEVKILLRGGTAPGMDPEAAQAYANYIRRLQTGMSGFTCYASLQMPR
jgi:hypothetical protein